jgi:hypothetical protein
MSEMTSFSHRAIVREEVFADGGFELLHFGDCRAFWNRLIWRNVRGRDGLPIDLRPFWITRSGSVEWNGSRNLL